ncbi:MAG TPA: hypothetical protein VJM34_18735 [Novosphingobium sp.]|nr:hypothetical protein [Novosphingobium sp.]
MKFDSNLAWKQASAAVSLNREVALALAGVFFMLPTLALTLLFPQPEPTAAMDQKAIVEMAGAYYLSILPFVIPMILFQAAGTLALIALLTDRGRPTVGQAIGLGVRGVLPYFLAQLLLGVAGMFAGGVLMGLPAAIGAAAVGIAATLILFIYVMVRMSLVPPIIVVEGQRNPIEILRRSWDLTRGNAGRVFLFYLLVFIAFMVVVVIASALFGVVLTLLAGQEGSTIGMAVISSLFSAVMALYFVAIVAAVHRQLAGPPPRIDSATFE